MKNNITLFIALAIISGLLSCSKDDSDSTTPQQTASTTSGQTSGYSTDRLIFDKDTIKQFSKSVSTVANHAMVKATHISADPVLTISFSDATLPASATNYTITQSGLSSGKCNLSIVYNGRFYVAGSGSVSVSTTNGQSTLSLGSITCVSSADPQSRRLSGTLSVQ